MSSILAHPRLTQMLLTDLKREAIAPAGSTAHQSMLSDKKPRTLTITRRTLPRLSMDARFGDFERVFHYFDEDGDGKISPTELRNGMRSVGEELSPEDAEAVVESTDSDGDGLLGFEDFVKLVEVEGEEEKGRSMREAFRVFEMEGQEFITPKSLRRALERLGERKSIEDCTTMVRRFDLNGDGVISFDEFCVMML